MRESAEERAGGGRGTGEGERDGGREREVEKDRGTLKKKDTLVSPPIHLFNEKVHRTETAQQFKV